jgi:Cd2+/Zn2+-exporting ATPase
VRSKLQNGRFSRISAAAVLLLSAVIFVLPFPVKLGLYIAAYVAAGGKVIYKAVKNISTGQVLDENFLMGIASIGAFIIGEYPESVAVMLFYNIGELFQDMALDRSRRSIKALLDIRPDYANLKKGDSIEKVSPEEVAVGDIIVVRPGERIPLDGTVIEGYSALDTAAITGESLPKDVGPGDAVISGSINSNGLLTLSVTKGYEESTVTKIIDMVQNASVKKAPTEKFITKFARIYTPAVVTAAAALAVIPPLITPEADFSRWLYRALIFLVASCPCALVISIPVSFFGGIGGASRNGILMKGGNYLEALNNVDTIVFDKTGTLTEGVFEVAAVSSGVLSCDRLLELAAYAEAYSSHPIAQSIINTYGKEIDKSRIEKYEEVPRPWDQGKDRRG